MKIRARFGDAKIPLLGGHAIGVEQGVAKTISNLRMDLYLPVRHVVLYCSWVSHTFMWRVTFVGGIEMMTKKPRRVEALDEWLDVRITSKGYEATLLIVAAACLCMIVYGLYLAGRWLF